MDNRWIGWRLSLSCLLLLSFSGVALPLSSPQSASLGVLFLGDAGKGNEGQKTVARAMQRFCLAQPCHLVAYLGDNFYPSGVRDLQDPKWKSHFEEPYAGLQLPFFVALGNHDYRGSIRAQVEYGQHSQKWHLPSRYYTFERAFVDFFVIDTNEFDREQRTWLAARLKQSKKPWKVVYGHHPIRSYGRHGDAKGELRLLEPLLKEGGVNFYLSGHDHNLQWIEGSQNLHLLVSGAGASPRRVRRGGAPDLTYASAELGFGYLLFSLGSVRVLFIDADGKTGLERTIPRPPP